MQEIQSLLQGFVIALTLKNVLFMFVGIILGVIIGVLVCVASLVNLVYALLNKRIAGKGFVERGQLKLVLSVLVPSLLYVVLVGGAGPVPGLGIYVASALFVAFFMRWLGGYTWWKVALVSVGNSVAFYLIFEVWFLVALPKGPLEALLGLA